LRQWLSTSQRKQFDANEYFDVIGCDTGRRYRIYYGRAMNVHELDEAGRLKMGWCFLPKGYLVAGDVMLAQKIALETFERKALAVAQRFVPPETFLFRARPPDEMVRRRNRAFALPQRS
jgi:hypothetical protein